MLKNANAKNANAKQILSNGDAKDPKVEENLSSTNFETTERRWRINAVPRAATDFAWQLKTEILTNVAKIMALTWMNGVNLN